MREEQHLTESEVLEFLSQKQQDVLWRNDHLLECPSCQNEVSSLYSTVKALKTVKLSREERLRMLTQGVTSELVKQRSSRRLRIPAIAAALVFLTFGIYFYTSFFGLSITTPNSSAIASAVSFGNVNENPKVYVQSQSVSVLGQHSNREATSKSIVSSVVYKGEVQDNGQSQQDSLSVASNYIIINSSTSF